jgi:hypothetical protein
MILLYFLSCADSIQWGKASVGLDKGVGSHAPWDKGSSLRRTSSDRPTLETSHCQEGA